MLTFIVGVIVGVMLCLAFLSFLAICSDDESVVKENLKRKSDLDIYHRMEDGDL